MRARVWGISVTAFALMAGCAFDPTGTPGTADDDITGSDAGPPADASTEKTDAHRGADAHAADAGPPCPDGFTEGDFGCYVQLTTERTWADAQTRCVELGAYLAKIDSADEDQWLRDSLPSEFDVWIGLSDSASEGNFKWIDGTALGAFSDWDLLEPNDFDGSENCVEFRIDFGAFADGWNDQGCDESRQAICERDKQ